MLKRLLSNYYCWYLINIVWGQKWWKLVNCFDKYLYLIFLLLWRTFSWVDLSQYVTFDCVLLKLSLSVFLVCNIAWDWDLFDYNSKSLWILITYAIFFRKVKCKAFGLQEDRNSWIRALMHYFRLLVFSRISF